MITFMDIFQINAITKPVRKIVHISRGENWGWGNKKDLIMFYIGYELENNMKFNLLENKVFGNIYSTKVDKTDDRNKKEVKLILIKDKEEILFKMRKRYRKLDSNNSSRWIIYDICGENFNI